MLSRAYIKDQHDKELLVDIEVMVHSVLHEIPASPIKLEEIRRAISDSTELQTFRQILMSGWPLSRKSVPREVEACWIIRDEIAVINGMIFAGRKLIIPHMSHERVEKSKVCARNVIYSPGLDGDISCVIVVCSTC